MTDIRLEGVTKAFGAFRAADSVDLEVKQGEFLTILGPSGSGKTTLLTLIAGLDHPTSGRILMGGNDVTRTPAKERNIGLVFQSYALFPHMTVSANVAFPLSVRRRPKAEVAQAVQEALRLVRLDGFGHRRPAQLSGGQQQRVALARAIVFKPNVLLLDEPLGALDRKLREELQLELKQLQRTIGVTTILVTHDQEEALSLSDRIMVLDRGCVQQVATPEEAYLRPANHFVAEFLGTTNFVELPGGRKAVVRPERIRIRPDGEPGGEMGEPGVVAEAVYLGQTVRYYVRLKDGRSMVATTPFIDRTYRPGDAVRLAWNDDDAWQVA